MDLFYATLRKERQAVLEKTVEQIVDENKENYSKALDHVYDIMVSGGYNPNKIYDNPFCPRNEEGGGSQSIPLGDTVVSHLYGKLIGIGVQYWRKVSQESELEKLFSRKIFDLELLEKAEVVLLRAYQKDLSKIKEIFLVTKRELEKEMKKQEEKLLEQSVLSETERTGDLILRVRGLDRLDQNLIYVDYFLEKLDK